LDKAGGEETAERAGEPAADAGTPDFVVGIEAVEPPAGRAAEAGLRVEEACQFGEAAGAAGEGFRLIILAQTAEQGRNIDQTVLLAVAII